MEWWFNNSGVNLLKGVDGDPENPIRLPTHFITDFLSRIPAARASFERLVPTMLEDEQIRLRAIAAGPAHNLTAEYRRDDDFQSSQNRAGVRTAGKYGGTRRGGNV